MLASERFVIHDRSFVRVVGRHPRLVEVVAIDAHEGPVYVAAEDALYFTTVPVRRGRGSEPEASIRRLGLDGDRLVLDPGRVTTVDAPVTMPNGMTLDPEGALLVCEQGGPRSPARLSRLDLRSGRLAVVAERSGGLPLNSPNDVAFAPDGAAWFTDPAYGHLQGFRPRPRLGDLVHRVDPATGDVEVVADGFDKPNGLAFSPDGSQLYVADSGAIQGPGSLHPDRPHHVVAFDVEAGRRLANRRLVAEIAPGYPDGLKVDREGRLYVSCATGVQVLTPDGALLGEIRVPGAVNFTFGGDGGHVLFVTADTAVWAVVLASAGPESTPTDVPVYDRGA